METEKIRNWRGLKNIRNMTFLLYHKNKGKMYMRKKVLRMQEKDKLKYKKIGRLSEFMNFYINITKKIKEKYKIEPIIFDFIW